MGCNTHTHTVRTHTHAAYYSMQSVWLAKFNQEKAIVSFLFFTLKKTNTRFSITEYKIKLPL